MPVVSGRAELIRDSIHCRNTPRLRHLNILIISSPLALTMGEQSVLPKATADNASGDENVALNAKVPAVLARLIALV